MPKWALMRSRRCQPVAAAQAARSFRVAMKVSRCGGLTEARRILEYMEQHGLLFFASGVWATLRHKVCDVLEGLQCREYS